MKTTRIHIAMLAAVLALAAAPMLAQAQNQFGIAPSPGALPGDSGTVATTVVPSSAIIRIPDAPVRMHIRDLSGPRLGFTFAQAGSRNERALKSHGMGPTVSQFGWHFEHEIAPTNGGPALVTEVVPLLGGFEYGKFIPTLNAAIGVRTPAGWEIGMGPSLTLVNSAGGSSLGLVVAVGKTLDYGGVSLPLNVAASMNNKGTMISLLAGYAIRRPN